MSGSLLRVLLVKFRFILIELELVVNHPRANIRNARRQIIKDALTITTDFRIKLCIKLGIISVAMKTYCRVYHIVAYLQVGVYHIVTYHDRNFIRKWTSGICRVRKLYRI